MAFTKDILLMTLVILICSCEGKRQHKRIGLKKGNLVQYLVQRSCLITSTDDTTLAYDECEGGFTCTQGPLVLERKGEQVKAYFCQDFTILPWLKLRLKIHGLCRVEAEDDILFQWNCKHEDDCQHGPRDMTYDGRDGQAYYCHPPYKYPSDRMLGLEQHWGAATEGHTVQQPGEADPSDDDDDDQEDNDMVGYWKNLDTKRRQRIKTVIQKNGGHSKKFQRHRNAMIHSNHDDELPSTTKSDADADDNDLFTSSDVKRNKYATDETYWYRSRSGRKPTGSHVKFHRNHEKTSHRAPTNTDDDRNNHHFNRLHRFRSHAEANSIDGRNNLDDNSLHDEENDISENDLIPASTTELDDGGSFERREHFTNQNRRKHFRGRSRFSSHDGRKHNNDNNNHTPDQEEEHYNTISDHKTQDTNNHISDETPNNVSNDEEENFDDLYDDDDDEDDDVVEDEDMDDEDYEKKIRQEWDEYWGVQE